MTRTELLALAAMVAHPDKTIVMVSHSKGISSPLTDRPPLTLAECQVVRGFERDGFVMPPYVLKMVTESEERWAATAPTPG